jgi:ribosome-associated heat shock protein Hsp15
VRLDVWLDVACLYRTRSEAQKAIRGGKVEVNRQRGKPHRELKEGDEIELSRPLGRKQTVIVRGFSEHHVPRAEARTLYEDVTPPPTPEEAEMRRTARLARPFVRAAQVGSPDKRERRELRRMKEGLGSPKPRRGDGGR